MTFTLAHLSDPHLAPLPAPRTGELVGKRVTGYINWQRKRRFIHDRRVLDAIVADLKTQAKDHIAVTGDIANIAAEDEFAPGRAWLKNLGGAGEVSFVPGNHDIYARDANRYAIAHWIDFMSGDEGAGFPYLRRRGPLALIGLCSAVVTAPFMATGRLGSRQLDDLRRLLAETKKDGLFRVVLIHHPPVSEASRHKRLIDAAELLRVIAEAGAELLLHGHDHLTMLSWIAGPNGTRVPAVGVPSASAAPGKAKQPAAYNLYRIGGTAGAWRCDAIARGIATNGQTCELRRTALLKPADPSPPGWSE